MFHLVKLVFLLSILSGTANAQWGTVVAQSDTNRFITSQYKYGLVMPHQEVIVGLLDTTVSSVGIRGGNAYKVIVGSLLDYEDNCVNYTIDNSVATCDGSYELWRELEISTSWYQAARGDTTKMFPTNYAVTISTGKDSVNIWNRDTAELWMAFKQAGTNNDNANMNYLAAQNLTDIGLLDGKLYFGTNGGGIWYIDFLADQSIGWFASGQRYYEGNLHQRNDGKGNAASVALAVGNNTINAVAAVRDPFGLKDALGRPAHWWGVGTGSTSQSTSYYNPHDNTIKNRQATVTAAQDIVYTKTGIYYSWEVDGTNDSMYLGKSPFAHYQNPEYTLLWSGGSGAAKLAWAATGNATRIAASEGQSILGRNADLIHFASNAGVYNFHSSTQNGNEQGHYVAKQRFSSTVNAPVEFGPSEVALAFEGNATDSSPNALSMTTVGTLGYISSVFGSGVSTQHNSYLTATVSAISNGGFSGHFWFKSSSASNPASSVYLFQAGNAAGSEYLQVYGHTDGTLVINRHDGSTQDEATSGADVWDGNWHHVAFRSQILPIAFLEIYIDGILAGSDGSMAATGAVANDRLHIFTRANSPGVAQNFNGFVDDFWLQEMGFGLPCALTPEAIASIHAEGRKKLGMGTPVFTRTTDDALLSNNVVEVDALDNGMWAVAFSDANTVQVFDGRIPVQQIAAPAGTVKSLALIQSPGTDSVGVAIGTTTNLKFVQPSVNLREAMAHQYQEPIYVGSPVVVDSAGVDGIFWTGDDAVDAAANANRSHIKFATGTYGKFSADQDGQWIQGSGQGHTYTLGAAPFTLIDGSTVNDAITLSGVGVVLSDFAVQTDEGAGNAHDAITISGGQNQVIRDIIIMESDQHGINQTTSTSTSLFTNIRIYDVDNYGILVQGGASQAIGNFIGSAGADGIYVGGVRTVIEGNYINPNTGDGIRCDSAGDNSVFVGNMIHDGGGITLNSGCDYSVVDGNASDGGVSNNGSNNVIGDNVSY